MTAAKGSLIDTNRKSWHLLSAAEQEEEGEGVSNHRQKPGRRQAFSALGLLRVPMTCELAKNYVLSRARDYLDTSLSWV